MQKQQTHKSPLWACAIILGIALAETGLYALVAPQNKPSAGLQDALSPKQAILYMRKHAPNLLVLDVRTEREFSGGHHEGALNIPIRSILARAQEIPAGRPILIQCAVGFRGLQAYKILKKIRPDLAEMRYVRGTFLPSLL